MQQQLQVQVVCEAHTTVVLLPGTSSLGQIRESIARQFNAPNVELFCNSRRVANRSMHQVGCTSCTPYAVLLCEVHPAVTCSTMLCAFASIIIYSTAAMHYSNGLMLTLGVPDGVTSACLPAGPTCWRKAHGVGKPRRSCSSSSSTAAGGAQGQAQHPSKAHNHDAGHGGVALQLQTTMQLTLQGNAAAAARDAAVLDEERKEAEADAAPLTAATCTAAAEACGTSVAHKSCCSPQQLPCSTTTVRACWCIC
jgi:hypothetical protein